MNQACWNDIAIPLTKRVLYPCYSNDAAVGWCGVGGIIGNTLEAWAATLAVRYYSYYQSRVYLRPALACGSHIGATPLADNRLVIVDCASAIDHACVHDNRTASHRPCAEVLSWKSGPAKTRPAGPVAPALLYAAHTPCVASQLHAARVLFMFCLSTCLCYLYITYKGYTRSLIFNIAGREREWLALLL